MALTDLLKTTTEFIAEGVDMFLTPGKEYSKESEGIVVKTLLSFGVIHTSMNALILRYIVLPTEIRSNYAVTHTVQKFIVSSDNFLDFTSSADAKNLLLASLAGVIFFTGILSARLTYGAYTHLRNKKTGNL